jgi:hypothetical protein
VNPRVFDGRVLPRLGGSYDIDVQPGEKHDVFETIEVVCAPLAQLCRLGRVRGAVRTVGGPTVALRICSVRTRGGRAVLLDLLALLELLSRGGYAG